MSQQFKEYRPEEDLLPCVATMRHLRPHLEKDDAVVVARFRRQMAQGYRLAGIVQEDRPVALIGFRLSENLVFGPFLYIDDVVVDPDARGGGLAAKMLEAVREIAVAAELNLMALDTALSNATAQNVYHKAGFETVAYHLIQRLTLPPAS
jgi:ribosomal protein S18 acetylase RimI-like enzyme